MVISGEGYWMNLSRVCKWMRSAYTQVTNSEIKSIDQGFIFRDPGGIISLFVFNLHFVTCPFAAEIKIVIICSPLRIPGIDQCDDIEPKRRSQLPRTVDIQLHRVLIRWGWTVSLVWWNRAQRTPRYLSPSLSSLDTALWKQGIATALFHGSLHPVTWRFGMY